VLGLRSVPTAGEEIIVVESELRAREITSRRDRVNTLREQLKHSEALSVPEVEVVSVEGKVMPKVVNKETVLDAVIKADGVGTLEALEQIVKGIAEKSKDVRVNIIDKSVGDVNLSDIQTASNAGNAIVLAFNVGIADATTRSTAKEADIKIVRDSVIYRLEDELVAKIESLMPKEKVVVHEGSAIVKQIFNINNKSNTTVAGLLVQSGKLKSGSSYIYSISRNGVVTHSDAVAMELRRFKDTVHEVEKGIECGLTLEKLKDFEVGDEITCSSIEWRSKKLVVAENYGAVQEL
jgi:translation initiation factor IF-2